MRFDGEDLTDVLGAVVQLEPNWVFNELGNISAPTGRPAQKDLNGRLIRKAINHVQFNEAWIRSQP